MNPAETNISIIIPTHNRAASTKRLLDKLGMQTYPSALMEVIVVANSCEDDTVNMLRAYKPSYKFNFAETNGAGPAVPRNKGASMATGQILIFLDDDVEPSNGLAEAHVRAHEDDNTVVIGYLPLRMQGKTGYFRKALNTWWENKFQEMRNPGHRFCYEDLLSGNFSISSKLFQQVNGFITSFRCRDDYELGIRLLDSNAQFKFSTAAMGLHCDEVTDVDRSLKRKREEGRTDVLLCKIHPGITNSLQDEYREKKFKFPKSRRAYFLIHTPRLTNIYAGLLKWMMNLMENWKLFGRWDRLNYKLNTYWYYRGLMDELQTRENLIRYLNHHPVIDIKNIDIDLSDGLEQAKTLLDRERPHTITIWHGTEKIGSTSYKPGTERLRGAHLKRILATKFSKSLMNTLALQSLAIKASA